MALVGNTPNRVDIPHEQGEWMELRRLSWRQREQASDAQTEAVLERMKRMGGDLIAAMRQAGQQQENPGDEYDRATVLRLGIVRWSYAEAVTPETIDQLDEETAAWAYREILALNQPRSDADRKNVS